MNTLYIIFELDQLITILVYILQLLQELEQMLIIAIWSSFMRLPFKFARPPRLGGVIGEGALEQQDHQQLGFP